MVVFSKKVMGAESKCGVGVQEAITVFLSFLFSTGLLKLTLTLSNNKY